MTCSAGFAVQLLNNPIELGIVCVVGKSQWVRIFELLGIDDE